MTLAIKILGACAAVVLLAVGIGRRLKQAAEELEWAVNEERKERKGRRDAS